MNRREFLVRVGGTLVVAPMILQITSCGGGDGGTAPRQTDQVTGIGTGSGHTHGLTVLCTQIAAAVQITITSGSGGGHTHNVTLDATQLGTLASGAVLNFDTNDIHLHSWTIQKAADQC